MPGYCSVWGASQWPDCCTRGGEWLPPTPPTPPQFRRKPRRNHLDLDTADILSYTKRTRRQTAHQRGKKRVAFRSEVFGETITPR